MLPGTERAIARIAEQLPRLVAALEAVAAGRKDVEHVELRHAAAGPTGPESNCVPR